MTAPLVDPLAAAAMVARCRWDPTEVVTDVDIELNGDGSVLLTLPSLNVTTVSAVQLVDDDGTTRDLIIGPADGQEVTWRADGELRWRGCGGWPCGDRNVKVTYSGGYGDIPADLAAALASLSKRTSGLMVGATSRRMGTAAVTLAQSIAEGGLLITEQMVFDRYRIVGIA
jgi:hypothetical protein